MERCERCDGPGPVFGGDFRASYGVIRVFLCAVCWNGMTYGPDGVARPDREGSA